MLVPGVSGVGGCVGGIGVGVGGVGGVGVGVGVGVGGGGGGGRAVRRTFSPAVLE